MIHRTVIAAVLAGFFLLACLAAEACCPAGPTGKPVVNADQTVIIIWDPVAKMQHFIRQASFKSDADDFAFLVPSPNQPELSESGNEAFQVLRRLTEPEIKYVYVERNCDSQSTKAELPDGVRVLEKKMVAGFHAAVLETRSAAIACLKHIVPSAEAGSKTNLQDVGDNEGAGSADWPRKPPHHVQSSSASPLDRS